MPQVLEIIGAGEGNRTLVISLEGFCSTIELHPQIPRSGPTGLENSVSVLTGKTVDQRAVTIPPARPSL
jgi:hypothetical protein